MSTTTNTISMSTQTVHFCFNPSLQGSFEKTRALSVFFSLPLCPPLLRQHTQPLLPHVPLRPPHAHPRPLRAILDAHHPHLHPLRHILPRPLYSLLPVVPPVEYDFALLSTTVGMVYAYGIGVPVLL